MNDVRVIPRPELKSPGEKRFYEAAERHLDTILGFAPTSATHYGYHKYDGDLEDFSPGAVASRTVWYEKAAAEFGRFRSESLTAGALIDLDLILEDIDASLFTLRDLRPWRNDPSTYNEILGYATLLLTLLEDADPAWPERLASLLSRMEKIPAFLETAKSNLEDPSALVTRFIAQQNRANIAFFRETLPSLYPRAPELAKRLSDECARVLAALNSYQAFLEGELLERARGDWRLGPALWPAKLRHTLQSDMTPEEIVARAWKRLESERQEMLQLAGPLHARMFPSHSHGESGDDLVNVVVKEVIGEVSKRHSTPENLFRDVKSKWVPRTIDFIRRSGLITLPPPSDNFVVERTPGFLDGLAVAFFNPPPAFEPHRKKSFWISSIPGAGGEEADRRRSESFLREYNDYGLQSLTIHEALPGHYVQFYYALNSPYASIYKKIFSNSTFAEGWAVLAEEQMFRAGYAATEPECLLIHKKINLRSPINAILDARLHTAPMAEEEADRWALDLMQRFGFQEEAEAIGKLRRAKVTSTQLSTYFVGYMELSDLMEEYRRDRGAAFSQREFNERLLSYGTIPPRAIRRLMLGEP